MSERHQTIEYAAGIGLVVGAGLGVVTMSETTASSAHRAVLGRRTLAVLIFVHGFAHLVGVTKMVAALRDDTSIALSLRNTEVGP